MKDNKKTSLDIPDEILQQESEKTKHITTNLQNHFLSAYITCNGVVKEACEKIGLPRTTYYNWLWDKKNNAKFLLALNKLREMDIDNLEDAFKDLVEERNPQVVMFGLKTRGKDRGYSEPSKNMINILGVEKIEISFGEPGDKRESAVKEEDEIIDVEGKNIEDQDNTDDKAEDMLGLPERQED